MSKMIYDNPNMMQILL